MDFDEAIRDFLSKFRLPGEAQKIDRIMELFSTRFCENNPTIFPNPDCAYVLAFSIIMLNTDSHNPAVKNKMTKRQFVTLNRGIAAGNDLPPQMLENIYERILTNELKMDISGVFARSAKKGWLHKQGNNKMWQKRFFVLSNNCLYYFNKEEVIKQTINK